ncbi:uncharacterized protein LOC110459579 isoform X2 [Mizuhopecten yessoensis]|uniref:uncharacterized protein LOC110441070 isoform X2 n=1 Tax=Mizuhopecten yessoensis TaxID=6573 RepID=UPI000B45BA5E|nr:uncharacterized protein LOC110441070 isoform X2 [Mizuhopecten yessoensis]XP_021367594.1 uncharacterized protein LOC110459579 isoform X2 [Mizuhopecten yessoensis]
MCNSIMTDTEEVPIEVIELHNHMVDKLGSEIGQEDDRFHRLINLFDRIPLQPTDKHEIKNMSDLIGILMNYTTIKYGEYKALTDKLEITHKRMKSLVIEYVKKMDIAWRRARGENSSMSHKTFTDQATAYGGSRQKPGVQAVQGTNEHPKTDREWRFYLDWISDKLTTEISTVATYLRVSSDKQTQIHKDNNIQHEKCFQILWEWYRKAQETNKIEVLKDALISADRKDITDYDIPQTTRFTGDIPSPETPVTAIDLQNVSKHIGTDYPSLARYFGIDEADIHASKHDKERIQEQARDVLQKCTNQTLLKTRQQLCDGLCYKERKDITDILIKGWQVAK